MSVGSTVSLVWGVQVDTVPLLLASQCYVSYHQAEIFFALLSVRIRTNTLQLELSSFASSSISLLPRTSIASLPLEITDLILDELFGTLYAEQRSALLEDVGRCCCSGERERAGGSREGHQCGIECSFWIGGCCSSVPQEHLHTPSTTDEESCYFESRFEYWHEFGRRSAGGDAELLDLLKAFNLHLIFIHNTWIETGSLPSSVIGIPSHPPFEDVPPLPFHERNFHRLSSRVPKPHHSLVLPEEDIESPTVVTSLPSLKPLSDEEKRRFKRLFGVLRLKKAGPGSEKAGAARKALEGGDQGENGSSEERREGKDDQPSLLLTHFSWLWL